MKRYICGPTTASARPALRSADTWTSTTAGAHTRALTARHQIKPTSTRCHSAWQPNPGKDVLRTNNPSKRMADPLEIAKLAVYLASDDSAYVVGADFLIDGGVTAISGVGG